MIFKVEEGPFEITLSLLMNFELIELNTLAFECSAELSDSEC